MKYSSVLTDEYTYGTEEFSLNLSADKMPEECNTDEYNKLNSLVTWNRQIYTRIFVGCMYRRIYWALGLTPRRSHVSHIFLG
jgi:hypothetical protein